MKRRAGCWRGILLVFCLLTVLLPAAAGAESGTPLEAVSPVQAASGKSSAAARQKKGWVVNEAGERVGYLKNYKRVKGLVKIGKYTYYFNKKGVLKKGKVKKGGTTYYLNDEGQLQASKSGGRYYYANGKRMTETDAEEWETILRAEKLVKKLTDEDDSQATKMLKCFRWCMSKPYRDLRRFHPWDGWTALNANDLYLRGTGECHAYASAFAYMAYVIGIDSKIYVCNDSDGTRDQGHSWCEIDGYVYDPLFADTYGLGRYYEGSYSGYDSRPVLKVKIPYMSPKHAE